MGRGWNSISKDVFLDHKEFFPRGKEVRTVLGCALILFWKILLLAQICTILGKSIVIPWLWVWRFLPPSHCSQKNLISIFRHLLRRKNVSQRVAFHMSLCQRIKAKCKLRSFLDFMFFPPEFKFVDFYPHPLGRGSNLISKTNLRDHKDSFSPGKKIRWLLGCGLILSSIILFLAQFCVIWRILVWSPPKARVKLNSQRLTFSWFETCFHSLTVQK